MTRREPVGRVVDTYPFDGGQVQMAVVRLAGAFGGRRLLSLDEAWFDGYGLRTPFAAWQVEDSPSSTAAGTAPTIRSAPKSYWLFEEPAVFARAA